MSFSVKKDLTPINFSSSTNRKILAVVLHSMAGTQAGSIAWFKNPNAKASAHYCISKSGEIVQCVEDKNIAWHAGVFDEPIASWLKPNPNNVTIGIELEDEKKGAAWVYPQVQIDALAWLVKTLCDKYSIPRDTSHILLHKNLNPSRRSDPVGNFEIDWVLGLPTEPVTPPTGKTYSEEEYQKVVLARDSHWNFIIKLYDLMTCSGENKEAALEARVRALMKVDGQLEDALKEVQKQKDERAAERAEFERRIKKLTEQVLEQNTELDKEKKQNQQILTELNKLQQEMAQAKKRDNIFDKIFNFLTKKKG